MELILPSLRDQSQPLTLSLTLRETTFKAQFPMDSPVIFEEDRLLPSDAVQISVLAQGEEVGRSDFLLRDQFQQSLEGDFEVWLKVAEVRTTPPVGERERPGKEEGVTLLKNLYTEGESPTSRQARMRVGVSLREVAKKPERDRHPPRKAQILPPEGLPHCARCEYLERLTAAQQNELQSNSHAGLEESEKSYKQVSTLLEKYNEETAGVDINVDTDLLALDLAKTIKGQTGALTAQEADHLRMVILGLNEKLKALQVLQREVMSLREELLESQRLRRELEESVEETTEQLKKQSAKQDELHAHLIQERQAAVEALRLQHLKYKEKLADEDRLQSDLSKHRGLIQKLLSEAANYAQMKAHIEALKAELDESERQRQLLRQQYGKSGQDFDARIKEDMQAIAKLTVDKETLQGEVQKLQADLHTQRTDNDKLRQEILTVKGRVSQLEQELTVMINERASLEEAQKLVDHSHENATTIEAKMQEAAGEFGRRQEDVLQLNLKLQEEKVKLTSALNEVENTVELKNEQIQDLTREKLLLTSTVATLEQLLCVQEDLRQMADTMTAQNSANTTIKDQLLKELATVAQSLMLQSEKGLAANRLLSRLREMTEDKEVEVESLRRLVTELKQQRPVYIPAADDSVDQAVAAYSNGKTPALAVPFLREEAGTYVFGSRRVFVKLEMGRLVVRVGGGFMHVEEFVDTYTPLELDKLEARETEMTTRHQSLLRKLASQAAAETLQGKGDKAGKRMQDYFGPGAKVAGLFTPSRSSLSPPRPGRGTLSPQ